MPKLYEFDQYISPDGEVYHFHNGIDKFIMSIEGTGMPPIDYITQRGPFQHGETVVDYRLAPRIIQLVHDSRACDRYDYYDRRDNILDLLRPNRQTSSNLEPGTLRKIRPDKTIRDIDVWIDFGPAFSARNLDTWNETLIAETIRFRAPDPTFYNPTIQTAEWVLAASDQLVFPITFPIFFGGSIIGNTLNITYPGTWLTYPYITINGPLNGPIIENETTDEKIHLQYNVSYGETVTIQTAYANKTVENNLGTNLLGTVSEDSDLATFHIEVHPKAPGGVNVLRVSGGGASVGVTNVCLGYYIRYIGY